MAKCPYCENEVEIKDVKQEEKQLIGIYHKLKMFFCPHCEKILGFSEAWGQ